MSKAVVYIANESQTETAQIEVNGTVLNQGKNYTLTISKAEAKALVINLTYWGLHLANWGHSTFKLNGADVLIIVKGVRNLAFRHPYPMVECFRSKNAVCFYEMEK